MSIVLLGRATTTLQLMASLQLNSMYQNLNLGFATVQTRRGICTTTTVSGKRNFRQLFIGNKRGTRVYKQLKHEDPDRYPDIPVYTDTKPIGYRYGKTFKVVPEMIPQLVIPDLKDCPLKPYVSYRANETVEPEFTAQSLFSFVYADKIKQDFEKGRLDDAGQPLEPSEEEKLTAEQAFIKARQTGSDIFSERIPEHWECLKLKRE